MRRGLTSVMVTVLALTACTSPQAVPGGSPAPAASSSAKSGGPALVSDGAASLLGKWVPDPAPAGAPRLRPVYVDFRDGGTWSGSDGCNELTGRWQAGPDGSFGSTVGVGTDMACRNVNLYLNNARRASLDGQTLKLMNAAGHEVCRLRRA